MKSLYFKYIFFLKLIHTPMYFLPRICVGHWPSKSLHLGRNKYFLSKQILLYCLSVEAFHFCKINNVLSVYYCNVLDKSTVKQIIYQTRDWRSSKFNFEIAINIKCTYQPQACKNGSLGKHPGALNGQLKLSVCLFLVGYTP